MSTNHLAEDVIELLMQLIEIPSFSGEESQTAEGEALRDDKNFTFVSAWEYQGEPSKAKLHKEVLKYENIELKTRSYK